MPATSPPKTSKDSSHGARSKGFDPGTTLYTDRVILHNFFGRLKIDNPVKEVPKLAKFRKRPVAYPDADLKKFFGACTDWDRAFFALLLATGLRKGEMQTLEWSDFDLARRRVTRNREDPVWGSPRRIGRSAPCRSPRRWSRS
jgi:integrase